MRSQKHKLAKPFEPFKNPTPKVREAWSRIAGTLCASSFTGSAIVLVGEDSDGLAGFRLVAAFVLGVIFLLFSIYSLKGADK
jgi:hypothetical protein